MRVEFINFNDLYDPERVLTNNNPFNKDKTFSDDGIYSEKFFGKRNTMESISYQCECGAYKGKFLENYVCEKCGKPVKFISDSLSQMCWIDLKDYYIINPVMFKLLKKIFGKQFSDVIAYNRKLDKDGNILPVENPSNDYSNIGLIEFKDKFDEIFEYFYKQSKNKDKENVKKIIDKNREILFINKLPVYSLNLRPCSVVIKDKPIFNFDEINVSYNYIIRHSNIINQNKNMPLIVLPNLYNIQNKANVIFNKVVDNLSGKYGFIRTNSMGNRLNFSSRCVITPLPSGYGINEIVLPYLAFTELYMYHIIAILSQLKNISLLEAQRILVNAQAKFDEEVYQIGKDIIRKTVGGCKLLINRNPTISYGSIYCLNLTDIKHDYNDFTMSLHNCILAPLNADYDGDVLNIVPLFDAKLKEEYEIIFSPLNMFISNDNGKFNSDLSLDKDQILGINVFNR